MIVRMVPGSNIRRLSAVGGRLSAVGGGRSVGRYIGLGRGRGPVIGCRGTSKVGAWPFVKDDEQSL
jgi:hypothetical protein